MRRRAARQGARVSPQRWNSEREGARGKKTESKRRKTLLIKEKEQSLRK